MDEVPKYRWLNIHDYGILKIPVWTGFPTRTTHKCRPAPRAGHPPDYACPLFHIDDVDSGRRCRLGTRWGSPSFWA